MIARDFFTVETVFLRRLYVLVFIELATRKIAIAEGEGEVDVYVLYFEPGGVIGAHEAGFGQLFLAASGDGWVAGGDGERIALAEGKPAFIQRGEIHPKGSQSGLTALMVQVRDLTALAR